MSVRPREAFEASQTFSLRDALGADPAAPQLSQNSSGGLRFNLGSLQTKARAPEPVEAALSIPRPVQSPSGLSLRFSSAPVAEARTTTLVGQPVQKLATSMPNLSFTSMSNGAGKARPLLGTQQGAVVAKEQASTKADVMRLTAYVDELTSRIKKTQGKLEQTETQLTRTSHVLCQERVAADQMLNGYKKDLAQAHETETKLRAEIAGTKKKSLLQDSTFMSSVGSALASDEQVRMQQRNLHELETKVAAMGDFKVKLEGEVVKLEGMHKLAQKELVDLRAAHEEAASKARIATTELETATKALQTVRDEHSIVVERLAAAKVEEATMVESVSALYVTHETMTTEVSTTQQQIQGMLLEHGDAARQLAEVKKRVSDLRVKEADAAEVLLRTDERCAEAAEAAARLAPTLTPAFASREPSEFALDAVPVNSCNVELCTGDKGDKGDKEISGPATPASKVISVLAPVTRRRRMSVTGAQAPKRGLCNGIPENATAHRARKVLASPAVSSLVAADAPVGLTLQRIGFVGTQHCVFIDATGAAAQTSDKDPATAMINAVVGDLKSKLTEISLAEPAWRAVAPLA